MLYRRARMPSVALLLFVTLLALSCTPSTAPTPGAMPTRSAIDTAAKVAKAADLASAAVANSLTAGLRAGTIDRDTAQVYASAIGPKVQTSLDGLRIILQTLQTSSTTVTNEQLAEGMLAVQEAIATAQEFAANPKTWTTMHGGMR